MILLGQMPSEQTKQMATGVASLCSGTITCALSWLAKYNESISSLGIIVGIICTIVTTIYYVKYRKKRYKNDLVDEDKN